MNENQTNPISESVPTQMNPDHDFLRVHKTKIVVGATVVLVVTLLAVAAFVLSNSNRSAANSDNNASQNSTAQVGDADEDESDEVEQEDDTDEKPGNSGTPIIKQPTPDLIEFTGITTFSIPEGSTTETHMTFINRGMPKDTQCVLTMNAELTNGTTPTGTETVVIGEYFSKYFTVTTGVYKFNFVCKYQDQTQIQAATVTVNSLPASMCYKDNFEVGQTVATVEDLKSELAGIWRGCVLTPFGMYPSPNTQYGVEITFRANGTYASRNYESVVYPNTYMTHPVFYYDADGESESKTYDIDDNLSGDSGSGSIVVVGPKGGSKQINQIKVSADGTKLSFDYYFEGNGKFTYQLEKVTE